MQPLRTLLHGGAMLCALITGPAPAAEFKDPLDTPPILAQEPWKKPLLSVDAHDSLVIAVGLRGVVIRSTDHGNSWEQALPPVSSDLTSIYLLNDADAWIAGHDGLILHSPDGGKSWKRQLDGRLSEKTFSHFYQQDNGLAPEEAARLRDEIAMNFRQGPSLPWLDVVFENRNEGFVVGSFGMIAHTRDGGKTWQPWLHRIDNPMALNLNALTIIGEDLWIAGERGTIFRLNREQQRFERIESGYAGSFFGLTGNRQHLVAYGLRGTIWESRDQGNTWAPLQGGFTVGISDAVSAGEAMIFASAGGQIRATRDRGENFQRLPAPPVPYSSLVLAGDQLVASSLGGIFPVPLTVPSNPSQTTSEE